MAEISHRFGRKTTFFTVLAQICLPEFLKHHLQMQIMLIKVFLTESIHHPNTQLQNQITYQTELVSTIFANTAPSYSDPLSCDSIRNKCKQVVKVI